MRLNIMLTTGVLLIGAAMAAAGDKPIHDHDMNMKKMEHPSDPGNHMAVQLKDTGTQKTCPVTGNPIDKSVFVDYQGKRIYFCCSSCIADFMKKPAKYLKKLSDKGEMPARLALIPQKTCPVMGNPIDKSIYTDYKGKRVYFCCGSCKSAFDKNPEQYLKKLDTLGEKPETL